MLFEVACIILRLNHCVIVVLCWSETCSVDEF
nr:hypothetical protein GPVRGNEL_GPVRGNEL_CDS_0001 [Caudoviricetes sp.]